MDSLPKQNLSQKHVLETQRKSYSRKWHECAQDYDESQLSFEICNTSQPNDSLSTVSPAKHEEVNCEESENRPFFEIAQNYEGSEDSFKSCESSSTSVASPESSKLNEIADQTLSCPELEDSASKFPQSLHATDTTGGDMQVITRFAKTLDERYGPVRLSGFVFDISPKLVESIDILAAICTSCEKIFPMKFFREGYFKMDCPYCDSVGHVACPDCSKINDSVVPLCIVFRFALLLICGTSEVEVIIENKEAEHFLDCRVDEYLSNRYAHVRTMVNLLRFLAEKNTVVFNVMVWKVPNTRVYLHQTTLKECQVHNKADGATK